MFLWAIAAGIGVAYVFLFYALPVFLGQAYGRLSMRSLYSVLVLLSLSVLAYVISFNISDTEVANRFLHAIGGGFIAACMFYLVVVDTKVQITRFQYFGLSMLVVIALGVLNEHAEFALQTFTSGIYTEHLTDTWLDLMSNTIGAFAGTAIFTWRIHKARAESPLT